jgi:hypothetical protein
MNLEEAHKYSSYHKSLIKHSKVVGCFYCLRIYRPNKIHEWIDGGQTALCTCGIDALLPGFWGLTDAAFLQAMYNRWFKYDPNNCVRYKMKDGQATSIIEVKDGKEIVHSSD